MGKNSKSHSTVSQAKHFVLGAGLVLVLATVLPALAQFPGGGGSPTINVPSIGIFSGQGATLGKFPGIGKGVSDEKPQAEYKKGREGEEASGKFFCESLGAEATKEECDAVDIEKGVSKKGFGDALKKADTFGKRGIAPFPFKKGKAAEEGSEAAAPTETPTTTEEGTPVTEPTKGRPTERLDKLPGFSRGVGGREGARTEEGAPSPQLFDPKQYKQFVDKDLLKLFGKKPVKPAIQLPEIEEGGGLEEDAQVFTQYLDRLLKAGRKLSKKSLRQNAIGFYSQVSKWCEDEEVDCGDELNELKYSIRKGSKQDLLKTLSESWQSIQEKVLSGGEGEEEEEEVFEEESF